MPPDIMSIMPPPIAMVISIVVPVRVPVIMLPPPIVPEVARVLIISVVINVFIVIEVDDVVALHVARSHLENIEAVEFDDHLIQGRIDHRVAAGKS